MLKKCLTLFLFGHFAQASSNGASFSSGSNFKAVPIEGHVVVTCEGFNGGASANYNCKDVILDPTLEDYFEGPKDSSATRVVFENLRDDGTLKIKNDDYDGEKGRSQNRINLWINSFFDRPLLLSGSNRIQYKIYSKQNDSPIHEGDLVINIDQDEKKRCPTTQIRSNDLNDCVSPQAVCLKYFAQNKYCR